MEAVCRLCARESKTLESVFTFQNDRLVADLISIICPIKIDINENFPRKICEECLEIILSASKLRDASVKNDILFRSGKFVLSKDIPIKQEEAYEDDPLLEIYEQSNSDEDDWLMDELPEEPKRRKRERETKNDESVENAVLRNTSSTNFMPSKQWILDLKSLDFRISYAYYINNQNLEEAYRVKVAKAIVSTILEEDPGKKLNQNDFDSLAKLIVEIFETEVTETYYSPSKKGSVPTGKLYSSYSNLRNLLASVGICSRETRNTQLSSVQVPPKQKPKEPEYFDEEFKALKQDTLKNFDEIRTAWMNTSNLRDKALRAGIPIAHLLKKIPVLRRQEGIELLCLDANRKYNVKDINISSVLKTIAPKILMKVKVIRGEPIVVNLLRTYENVENVDQTLLALILLPFIFSPSPTKRSRGQTKEDSPFKLGKADAYRFFCSHFETDELQQQFDNNLQPTTDFLARIYIVGNLAESPKAIVKLTDNDYNFKDPLEGFDALFKIHLALNTFPRQSISSWAFLDQFVYKSKAITFNNSQLATIINEMVLFSNKQSLSSVL